MPLFQTREWWSAQCGSGESFDLGCMAVGALLATDHSQIIAVGSHQGVLRLFRPSAPPSVRTSSKSADGGEKGEKSGASASNAARAYTADHLLLEVQLSSPILGLLVGQFMTGSEAVCLLVLAPLTVTVYTLGAVGGSAQFCLSVVYTHRLDSSAFSVLSTATSHSSTRGRFCALSLNCTLAFYDTEKLAFTCRLHDVILPPPITFLPSSDVILLASSSWILEAYTLSGLARLGEWQAGGATGGATSSPLYCDWSYNIGEPVLDIQLVAAPVSSDPATVLALCLHALYSLSERGQPLSTLLFDFAPACMTNFVNDKGHIVSVVCSHSGSLYIYSGAVLRWTAKLHHVLFAAGGGRAVSGDDGGGAGEVAWCDSVCCLTRVSLAGARGLLLLLTAAGRVDAAYLGTAPVIMAAGAPQLSTETSSGACCTPSDALNYERMDTEMAQLNDIIDRYQASHTDDTDSVCAEEMSPPPLCCSVVADTKLKLATLPTEGSHPVPCLAVNVAVTCRDTVHDVYIVFHTEKPFCVTPNCAKLPVIDGGATCCLSTTVYTTLSSWPVAPLQCLQLSVTATAAAAELSGDGGERPLLVTRAACRLPLTLAMHCHSLVPTHSPATATGSRGSAGDGGGGGDGEGGACSLILASHRPLVNLRQLFDDMWLQSVSSATATAEEQEEEAVVAASQNVPDPAIVLQFCYCGTDCTVASGHTESSGAGSGGAGSGGGGVVTLSTAKSSKRYRLQSDDIGAIWPVLDELASRLEKLYGDPQPLCLLSALPVPQLLSVAGTHLLWRQKRAQQLQQLDQLAAQLRAVQRRLLSRYKQLPQQQLPTTAAAAAPLAALEQLLSDTHQQLVATADSVETVTDQLHQCSRQLGSCAKLLQLLAALPAKPRKQQQQQQQEEEEDAEETAESEDGDHKGKLSRRDDTAGRWLPALLHCVLAWQCAPSDCEEQGWLEWTDTAANYLAQCLAADCQSDRLSVSVAMDCAQAGAATDTDRQQQEEEFVPADCSRLQRHLARFLDTCVAASSRQMACVLSCRAAGGESFSTALKSAPVRPASSRFARSTGHRDVTSSVKEEDGKLEKCTDVSSAASSAITKQQLILEDDQDPEHNI